jgi:alpha-2-macroglobulin-like protein
MRYICKVIMLLIFGFINAQSASEVVNKYIKQQQSEKVYAHLNNYLYLPEETVFFKLYISNPDNKPTNQSDYVYVDIFDSSNKKIESQTYLIENGYAVGSFTLKKEMPSGMYLLKAYTKFQVKLDVSVFEKAFFVQKVISPRVLMSLDFSKKGYGASDLCEADFTLKNIQNQPIKNQEGEFDIFIEGKKIKTAFFSTNDEGKARISFQLPEQLKTNDGIINVKINYDNFNESITKSIPIQLNFVDLQFLPESGNYIVNHASTVFFISKNEFGKPLDVSGFIEDENGVKIIDFNSFYDGMGKVKFTPLPDKKYYAVITSPFNSVEKFQLPSALNTGYSFSLNSNPGSVDLSIISTENTNAQLLIRNQDKLHQTKNLKLNNGINTQSIDTSKLPMGVYAISLLVNDVIVSERLVFVNYQDKLKIEIETDKSEYKPREKVQVSISTKDKFNKPVASNLSITVIDEKLISYIDDKQHNLLTWMFLGFELKGKIHEPRFYFNENESLEKRITAVDFLLNTHGWRKYSQPDVNNLIGVNNQVVPEKTSDIEGFVFDQTGKPVVIKIMLFTDQGNVYETKTNKEGFFKFNRTYFQNNALLVVENKKFKKSKTLQIINSISNYEEIIKIKDLQSGVSKVDKMEIEGIIKPIHNEKIKQVVDSRLNLDEDAAMLQEVVVVSEYITKTLNSSASYHVISREIPQVLAGQVTGVQIQSGTGQPGMADKVLIRGVGSLYGNRASSQPLIVVDGIPYANNEHVSLLSRLTPNMIHSITILKNEEATSVYGSRGMNGVILITTNNRNYNSGILLGKKFNYSFESINKQNVKLLNVAASFYVPKYTSTITDVKNDFRNCLYWNAVVQTDDNGQATFEFYNSDEVSTFTVIAEGTSFNGDLGVKSHSYVVKEPIQIDLKIPLFATQEDIIKLPLWIKNNSNSKIDCRVALSESDFYNCNSNVQVVSLQKDESKVVYFSIKAIKMGEKIPVHFLLVANNYSMNVFKEISIYGKGFPSSESFTTTKSGEFEFLINNPLENSIESELKVLLNPFSTLFDGLEGMLREPYGCFEQVSSVNYPNIMALQLMNIKGINNENKEKALMFLQNGYNKLKNYESRNGGFEWYGGNPGHESLTAYGLLQFHEMREFINIDKNLVDRSVKWLFSRKDNKGGFLQKSGKYGFSAVKDVVNNAYIVYVLSEIGQNNFKDEYDKALEEALLSQDAYRMALLALAAFNLNDIVNYKKLLNLINIKIEQSNIENVKIEQTVIRSYGNSQSVEWASLYALALMKEKKVDEELLMVLDFIQSSKKRNGFGSTQATALALKAITTFSGLVQFSTNQPKFNLELNDTFLKTDVFNSEGNIVISTKDLVRRGKNNFKFNIENSDLIPLQFYVNYYTYKPDNSPACELWLSTSLAENSVKVSETIRLQIELTNTTDSVVFNPLVRVGIPGGTSPEPWQLKELIEKEIVDYYEIFGSELVLYFREMDANQTKTIGIDLKAQVPGTYQGISSSAYLYYNNEHKNWNDGLQIEIRDSF